MQTQKQELITLPELARRLKLHPDTTRRLYWRGTIPGLKMGHRTLRFDFADVVAALKRKAGGKHE